MPSGRRSPCRICSGQGRSSRRRAVLSVDVEAVHREVATLARTVQEVAGRGDYDGAGRLIEDLGSMPPEIAGLLDRFADIPVDLEFVFDDSP